MSEIISKLNKVKFSMIPDAMAKQIGRTIVNAKYLYMYSAIVSYVDGCYQNTNKFRQSVVDALNYVSYLAISKELPDIAWVHTNPIDTVPEMEMDQLETVVGVHLLSQDYIEWNVQEKESPVISPRATITPPIKQHFIISNTTQSKSEDTTKSNQTVSAESSLESAVDNTSNLTNKEDLYIQPPKYPRFDTSKPWLDNYDSGNRLVIYTTLPEIPTKQNEISVTTNVNKMTDAEKLALFPNTFIRTRSPLLYEPQPDISYHKDLGLILPMLGYTEQQMIDNILKYPHIFRLTRYMNGQYVSMYAHIEIDGELYSTNEIWDNLPEANLIPKQSEYMKEYVVRRYLLERDIKHIEHKYPIFGSLDPYLTLFMPAEKYAEDFGLTDSLDLANKCLLSRIRYKQTRNPIIRRLQAK